MKKIKASNYDVLALYLNLSCTKKGYPALSAGFKIWYGVLENLEKGKKCLD